MSRTNEITPAQVAAARDRLKRWWSQSEHYAAIYPDADTVSHAYSMSRFDRAVVEAADAADKAKAKGTA